MPETNVSASSMGDVASSVSVATATYTDVHLMHSVLHIQVTSETEGDQPALRENHTENIPSLAVGTITVTEFAPFKEYSN